MERSQTPFPAGARDPRRHSAAGHRGIVAAAVTALLVAACGTAAAPRVSTGPHPAAERSDTLTVVLLGTTDTHGRLYAHDYYRGAATDHGLALLAPLVDSVREAHSGPVYLLDSGDWLQGNPLAFVHARVRTEAPSPIIRAMNLLRYDAAAIGNHEFNYGIPHLERAIEEADFPIVAANVFTSGSEEHAFRPSVLLPHAVAEGDTLLVGVTAVTPPGVHIWDRANVEGRLDFRDITASTAPVVAELRARGADLVVVLAHSGLEGSSYDVPGVPPENESAALAHEVPGIDVILVGHSHEEIADTTINGVRLAQARNWGGSLARVGVTLERRAPGEWVPVGSTGEVLRPLSARADTAFLDSLRWPHERTVAYVGSVVGTSLEEASALEARVRDTPILDFINEVQRRAAGADLSATAAFSLGARIPEGPVTIADLAGLYIYDNTLKAVRVTGRQLREYLERSAEYFEGWPPPAGGGVVNPEMPGYNFDVVSGVEYRIDLTRPVGQRIVDLRHQGRPVEPERTFTLALNNYRQGGGGGYAMLTGAPVVYDHQEDIRELLIEEVRRRGTIRPSEYFRESWSIVPGEAADSALAELRSHRYARGAPPAEGEEAAPPLRLRVLHTNDFHGALLPQVHGWSGGREVGGAAALAGYFREERAGFAGPTLIVDGGDMYQGSPISNLTDGRSTIDYYNAAGYLGAALGNHEFDWGVDILANRSAQAAYPFLAANVYYEGSDSVPPWIRPAAVVEAGHGPDTVTVGLIGLASPETPDDTKKSNVAGLEFRDPASAVDFWVPRLRAETDFVVVLAHLGAFCADEDGGPPCRGELVDLARSVRHAPDLIVGGHTHRPVAVVENGIALVEAATRGSRYGVVDLFRQPADSVASAWIRGLPVPWTDGVEPDSTVAALVERYRLEVGPRVNEVVATLDKALGRDGGEYALGRLIADAQRRAAEAQVAIMNNGGIRTGLRRGPVTWSDLYQVQPFENRIVRLVLTGEQLRQTLEHGLSGNEPSIQVSGLTVSYDPSSPPGARILEARLDGGRPLRSGATYTVAVNDFMAQGGSGFRVLPEALSVEETDIVDLSALVAYLRELPQPVRAPGEARLRPVRTAEGR